MTGTSRTCARTLTGQLAQIAQLRGRPLIVAYRTGFIYTQIIRSGNELKTGASGYDTEFSHDVIGILANLFTQGYTAGAHGLLDRARHVIGSHAQYGHGVWTYPWIWAIYRRPAPRPDHPDPRAPGHADPVRQPSRRAGPVPATGIRPRHRGGDRGTD